MEQLRDEPAAYDVLSSEPAFTSGRVIDVRTDVVAMPDGSSAERDVIVHPGAVGIIVLDDDNRVLLLRQYRHTVRRMLWEPPAGLLDEPGEDPLEAAKRELFEEAHVRASRWHVLLDAYTSPGMSDEAIRIYLARDVSAADEPQFEAEHEERDMELRWVPLEDAVAALLAGRLHNPMAAMGLLAAARHAGAGWSDLRPADDPWPEMSSYAGSRAQADAT
jgi:8-oxo-dGDP phosphatase